MAKVKIWALALLRKRFEFPFELTWCVTLGNWLTLSEPEFCAYKMEMLILIW